MSLPDQGKRIAKAGRPNRPSGVRPLGQEAGHPRVSRSALIERR